MRIRAWSTCVLIFIMGWACAQSSVRISGNYQNETLDEVFDDLADRYGLAFNYSPELAKNHRITVRLRNESLGTAVDKLLAQVPFRFILSGETHIVIIPDPSKTLAPPPASLLTVSGRVEDAQTGEPLPFASVGIVKTRRGTSSNSDGYFALPQLADEDSLEIEITYLGYRPIRILATDFDSLLGNTIALEPITTLLDDVLIQDYHQSAIQLMETASLARLDARKLDNLPNLGQPDVFQALQLIPGISATSGGSANLQVRGGTPDQNLVLFDDIPMYHLDHFYGVYSAFNPLSIQSVQIYKGGYPAKYDGRSTAVIDIQSRAGNRKDTTLEANVNLLSANLGFDLPLGKKFSLSAAGRFAYNGIIRTPLYDALTFSFEDKQVSQTPEWAELLEFDDNQWGPEFYFFDLNSKLTFYPTERDVIKASLFLSGDDLDLNYISSYEEEDWFYQLWYNQSSVWRNNGLSLSWARQWNEHWYTKVLFSYSDYANATSYDSGLEFGDPNFEEDREIEELHNGYWINRVQDGQTKIFSSYQPNSNHLIEFGATLNGLETDFYSELDGVLNGRVNEYYAGGIRFSWFVQDTWTPWENTKLTFGLRRNRYNPGDSARLFFAPRLSFVQGFGSGTGLTFKASAGIFQQFINQVSPGRFSASSQYLWVMGDGDVLPIQRSIHTTGGLQWVNDAGWMIDIEAYWRGTSGITDVNFWDNPLDLPPFQLLRNVGSSQAYGVDFTVHKDVGKYRGWINYSLGRVFNEIPIFNDGELYPANQDQIHELNIVQMYTQGKWDFSAVGVYGSGRPYTPPFIDETGEVIEFDYNAVNSERLPPTRRIDLSAHYSFQIKKMQGQIGLSIYNVLNARNIQTRNFGLVYTGEELPNGEVIGGKEIRQFDVESLGFTPNISINLSF